MNKSDQNRPNNRPDEDETLKQLAIAAQSASSREEQQRILNRMFQIIQNSNRLGQPHRNRFPHQYSEIYEEAKQDLWFYVINNIHKYEPGRGPLMAWLNQLMKCRFIFDASRKVLGRDLKYGDISQLDERNRDSNQTASLSELVNEYIADDPEGLLQEHIKNRPDVTLQSILVRQCAKVKWHDMAAEFDIPFSTLSSFSKRALRKFQPQILHYIQQHSQFS